MTTSRYQTVYAQTNRALLPRPPRGCISTRPCYERLAVRAGIVTAWLTLHVGAGTFQPVRTHLTSANISMHRRTLRAFPPRRP
jgi:S-adenosylmethionine:tRNA ribosyltransferase-isomerase